MSRSFYLNNVQSSVSSRQHSLSTPVSNKQTNNTQSKTQTSSTSLTSTGTKSVIVYDLCLFGSSTGKDGKECKGIKADGKCDDPANCFTNSWSAETINPGE